MGRKRHGGRRGGAESPGSARPPPPRGGDRGPPGPPVAARGGNAGHREQVGAGPGAGRVAGTVACGAGRAAPGCAALGDVRLGRHGPSLSSRTAAGYPGLPQP